MEDVRRAINAHYAETEPSVIVFEVLGATLAVLIAKYIIFNASGTFRQLKTLICAALKDKAVSAVFTGLKTIPGVQGQVIPIRCIFYLPFRSKKKNKN